MGQPGLKKSQAGLMDTGLPEVPWTRRPTCTKGVAKKKSDQPKHASAQKKKKNACEKTLSHRRILLDVRAKGLNIVFGMLISSKLTKTIFVRFVKFLITLSVGWLGSLW